MQKGKGSWHSWWLFPKERVTYQTTEISYTAVSVSANWGYHKGCHEARISKACLEAPDSRGLDIAKCQLSVLGSQIGNNGNRQHLSSKIGHNVWNRKKIALPQQPLCEWRDRDWGLYLYEPAQIPIKTLAWDGSVDVLNEGTTALFCVGPLMPRKTLSKA